MAFDSAGNWKPEDASVQKQLDPILSSDSALLQQAAGAGAKASNRRGLVNSSMGIGAAQAEAYRVAVPIASQNAQQIYGMNSGEMNNRMNRDINAANLAAAERERQLSAIVQLTGNQASATAQTLTNDKIPGTTRAEVQRSITAGTNSAIAALERLYGTRINWGTLNGPEATPTVPPMGGIGNGLPFDMNLST